MGMVVDIGIVKNHIKPKADSTLRNMRKDDLIEYIRCLENNYNVAVSFNNQQAKNIELLGITKVVRCKDCEYWGGKYATNEFSLITQFGKKTTPDDFCSSGKRKEK